MTLKPLVIDIYQGDAVEDWSKVYAAGIRGVILKATEGVSYRDKAYARRRKDALAAGLYVGSYHFNRTGNVAEQVDNFLAASGDLNGLLLALDWETPPHGEAMSTTEARQFLTLLMEKTGRTPDQIYIYGGNVLKEKIRSAEDLKFFGQFRLWLCQYAKTYKLPKAWDKYTLWQAAADGHAGPFDPQIARGIDGISTPNIDMNLYNGTDLAADWAPGAAVGAAGVVAGAVIANEPLRSSLVVATASTVKSAYQSRSIWAALAGVLSTIFGVLTDWAKEGWDWVMWAVGLAPDLYSETKEALSSAEEVSQWFNINFAAISMTFAGICVAIFIIRHLMLRQQVQAQETTQ